MRTEYTVEKSYEVYKDECPKKIVSSDKFSSIFIEEYNIKLKSPKTNTCSICGTIIISLGNAEIYKDHEATRKLKTEQELHHSQAIADHDVIKMAQIEATQTVGTYAITFDHQQAIPTPKVLTVPTFHKKKFWYNISDYCLYACILIKDISICGMNQQLAEGRMG